VKGKDVIQVVKKELGVNKDTELAARLGVTPAMITHWNNRPSLTSKQFASLLRKAFIAAAKKLQTTAVRPIVEFYPIQRCDSKQAANYELFSASGDDENEHPFKVGLKDDLSKSNGVYVFFDSRGNAIYAGKTRQNLWKEMNLAFNRKRGAVQKIKRVSYPERRVEYKTAERKSRAIKNMEVPIHELASYFSAYQVIDGMIDEIEALLIRSFANDLINIKMERFKQQRKRKRS
jgi:ribosomal protein S8